MSIISHDSFFGHSTRFFGNGTFRQFDFPVGSFKTVLHSQKHVSILIRTDDGFHKILLLEGAFLCE